jgi:steroid 5-alpha reductase family enzyme
MNNIPSLAMGLMMLAYWGRVVRLAWKIRRRTGKSANYVPREPLGLVLRFLWNPAVVIWIAHPMYSALLKNQRGILRRVYDQGVWDWAILAIAIAAFVGTLICWKKMGKSWRMGINPKETTQLIVSGPYAYIRHPIYALSSLLMICTMVILPTILMGIVGAIHLLLLQWEARREEKYLISKHGAIYEEYMRNTGRFIPLLGKKFVV